MYIHHIALWTQQLEVLKDFYEQYFSVRVTPKYTNKEKGFESYFLRFKSGASIELMRKPEVKKPKQEDELLAGYAHIAIALGSKEAVDTKTNKLMADGYIKLDGPRVTGDGYYESTILDPDGNVIELTV